MSEDFFTNDIFVVSPVAKRVYLEPGKSYDSYVKITNPAVAQNTLHYKISTVPYGVIGDEYTADFNSETEYSKIRDWIVLDEDEGYVEPNDTVTVHYKINVPEDAPGGGQYCAVAVQNAGDGDGTDGSVSVKDVIEITSILYASVNGETKREGEILENSVPAFAFKGPIKTSTTLRNDGNVHQDALITIKAESAITGRTIMLDGNEAENIDEEDETTMGYDKYSEIVMPESTRVSVHAVNGLPNLGIVRITQQVEFNGLTDVNEQVLLLCPIWFICLVVLAIASVVTMIVKKCKKKNRESES